VRLELVRAIPSVAGAAPARVRVYSVAGRLVRELVAPPGGSVTQAAIAWDGRDAAGRAVPPGLYFARAAWGETVASARVVLLP
jgi:hypothetical protein